MPVYSPPEKRPLIISERIDDVEQGYYRSMFRYIDALGKESEFGRRRKLYQEARFVIANYVYIIHERLELKKVRNIDYLQVNEWAAENKDLVKYLLASYFDEFEIAAFDKWIQPDYQIMRMGMYSPSTRQNKNTYH